MSWARSGREARPPTTPLDALANYTPGVSQRRAGATTYDPPDRLGSATRQTNSATATTATRSYDAFGVALSTTGAPVGPFGFAGGHGYEEDANTGLKLLGHRYYDPSTGRFLTRDPAGGWAWAARLGRSCRPVWGPARGLGTPRQGKGSGCPPRPCAARGIADGPRRRAPWTVSAATTKGLKKG